MTAARDHELDLAVRGGNHSAPGFGTCDGGVVCDLSGLRDVRAGAHRPGGWRGAARRPRPRHPRVRACHPGRVHLDHGDRGLTLGGSIGAYLSRRYGLTCDNLLSADVVTADGRFVTASPQENPDLFWALRGGGGNFGIVTSFEFQLHPVTDLVAGPIFFELDAAADVMAAWRDHLARAPRELGGFFGFQIAPPLPFILEDRHGDTLCAVMASWCGPADEADTALASLRAAGPVVAEHVDRVPYPAVQSAFDGLVPAGLQHYWKADFVVELSDEAIATHVDHGSRVPYVASTMHLYPIDGAVHDVAPDATAFAHRDLAFAARTSSHRAEADHET